MSEDIPSQDGGSASTAAACEYTFPQGATFIKRTITATATLAQGESR
jgi:hypothetical protein